MPWVFAARTSIFEGRDVVGIECQGQPLALYRVEGDVLATSDVCPHQGASLSAGCVVQGYIECPVHFALFDLRTGVSDGAVTTRPVRTFAVRVEGDDIYVDVGAAAVEENAG